ncbi:hypothetical protein ACFX2I_026453 [Malus domestica]
MAGGEEEIHSDAPDGDNGDGVALRGSYTRSIRVYFLVSVRRFEHARELLLLNHDRLSLQNHSEYTIDIYQMGKPNPDEKILSYNDVVLRRSDLDILSGPYFLNDRLIEFYFSYLSSCSEEILLIAPSIAFWMMNAVGQGLHEFLVLLNLPDKKTATKPTYQECSDSPQQVNGYDCGLFVLAIARVICSWYGSKDKGEQTLWFHAVREQVTPSVVAVMRNEILELIRGLMPVNSGEDGGVVVLKCGNGSVRVPVVGFNEEEGFLLQSKYDLAGGADDGIVLGIGFLSFDFHDD